MKKFILVLLMMFTLSWQAPTTNEDGTPLIDLAGYRVYYGPTPGNYSTSVDVGNVLTKNIDLPPDILYYFAVTAYDTGGNESTFSNEVSKIKYLDPAAPMFLQVY